MSAITTVTVHGTTVRLWAGGEGPPLLYLHGFEHHPGDAPFLRRLARTHRVLAPELPGYGTSEPLPDLTDVLDLVLFQRALVEACTDVPVDVIGHSLGGMLAAELAAISPHAVRRLVLVDAYGLWLDDTPAPDVFVLSEKELRAAKWHDPAAAERETTIFEPDPADPFAAVMTRTGNLAIAGKLLWPIPDRGLIRRLPFVSTPTLVVHGASDGLLPVAYGEALAAGITGAQLAVIDDAGHLPMVEQEGAFFAAVEPFLSEGVA